MAHPISSMTAAACLLACPIWIVGASSQTTATSPVIPNATAAMRAVAPEIQDGAKLFTPEAVKKANEKIAAIFRKHDRDLLIETFASVPDDDVDRVKDMDRNDRGEYFLKWAKDRVAQRAVNGVYVLICKEPRFLRVGIVEKQPHKFPNAFSSVVEETLTKEFKESRFDEGLEAVIQVVEQKLVKGAK